MEDFPSDSMLLWTQRVVLRGLVSTVGVLLLLCRKHRPTWQIQQFQQQQGPSGSTGSSNGGSGNVGGEQQPAQMAIPFFRSGNDDDALSRWSHLNHKVEEYEQDLVKAVQVCASKRKQSKHCYVCYCTVLPYKMPTPFVYAMLFSAGCWGCRGTISSGVFTDLRHHNASALGFSAVYVCGIGVLYIVDYM